MSSSILAPFVTAFNTLSVDAKAQILTLLTQFHANIAANPTKETVAAQGALVVLTAPTLLPVLETDAIKAANDALLTAATSVLAAVPPVAAPVSAPDSPAA